MRARICGRLWWLVVSIGMLGSLSPLLGQEGLRRIHVGDTMPEFSLAGVDGAMFRYEHKQTRVLALVLLGTGQNHLERVVTDMEAVAQTLRSQTAAFDCVGVLSGSGANDLLRSRDRDAATAFPVLADPNFALWGKLGAVAAPTAVLVGADHKVQWIKAGFGYDFVAGLNAQLGKALGLVQGGDGSVRVETLENTSARARRDRHVQLARTLAKKGRLEAAMSELEKARQLDPNAADVALDFGELLCRVGKNDAALKMVTGIKAESNQDKARVMLISAWARRQMGDPNAAEELLVKALALEPDSARILYELGKVYQAKGDADKALSCYRKALAAVFGDAEATGSSQKQQ
jgi:Tfp pilus assembly protein PilF